MSCHLKKNVFLHQREITQTKKSQKRENLASKFRSTYFQRISLKISSKEQTFFSKKKEIVSPQGLMQTFSLYIKKNVTASQDWCKPHNGGDLDICSSPSIMVGP